MGLFTTTKPKKGAKVLDMEEDEEIEEEEEEEDEDDEDEDEVPEIKPKKKVMKRKKASPEAPMGLQGASESEITEEMALEWLKNLSIRLERIETHMRRQNFI